MPLRFADPYSAAAQREAGRMANNYLEAERLAKTNPARARPRLEEQARNGYVPAMLELGRLCEEATPPDLERAAYYYQQARRHSRTHSARERAKWHLEALEARLDSRARERGQGVAKQKQQPAQAGTSPHDEDCFETIEQQSYNQRVKTEQEIRRLLTKAVELTSAAMGFTLTDAQKAARVDEIYTRLQEPPQHEAGRADGTTPEPAPVEAAPTWKERVAPQGQPEAAATEPPPKQKGGRKRKDPPPTEERLKEANHILWLEREGQEVDPEALKKARRDTQWAYLERKRQRQAQEARGIALD
jgi:hypothetical protein